MSRRRNFRPGAGKAERVGNSEAADAFVYASAAREKEFKAKGFLDFVLGGDGVWHMPAHTSEGVGATPN